MKTKRQANGVADVHAKNGRISKFKLNPERKTIKGKRVVILDEADFDRLMIKADVFEPLMPAKNAEGNYPALEAVRVGLAIRIIRHRRKAGLTQAELARRAGIRPESLNRIEQARVDPSIRTIEKIDNVLCALVEEYDD